MGPIRRCVGCRHSDQKDRLLRVVAVEGQAVWDRQAILPGRGAYVHRNRDCVDKAVGRGALRRALHAPELGVQHLMNTVGDTVTPEENRLNG